MLRGECCSAESDQGIPEERHEMENTVVGQRKRKVLEKLKNDGDNENNRTFFFFISVW